MARILYLMHVDWRWIRQRPQELAVGLVESGHDVRVLFTPQFQTGTPAVPRSGDSQVKRSALWSLPLRRFSPVRRINRAVQKWQVTLACRRSRPDHVWITAPELLQLVPERQ
ncbi:MAG TPA: hypothetical protein VFT70_19185, partial [Nocardioides sp.]|nr:hypothetical protein [Nocardioides sp.]